MTPEKLHKIKREIARLRRTEAKARDLEKVARQLGRKLVKRGREPMWESTAFECLFVLSIPRHGGKDLAPGTRKSILDQLEDDVLAWEDVVDDD
jgi:hypothetical protein